MPDRSVQLQVGAAPFTGADELQRLVKQAQGRRRCSLGKLRSVAASVLSHRTVLPQALPCMAREWSRSISVRGKR